MSRTRKNENEPRVQLCLFDLSAWMLRTTNRFPKNLRVSLGDRLDTTVLDMLVLAQEARFSSFKLTALEELAVRLESLRVLTRLAAELDCIKGKQREYVSKQIDEIGRQLGGWIKHQKRKA